MIDMMWLLYVVIVKVNVPLFIVDITPIIFSKIAYMYTRPINIILNVNIYLIDCTKMS